MDILIWIVFGALVGWAASFVMGTDTGIVWDIIVGIVGAVIGGWLMTMAGQPGVAGFNLYSFVVALIGAVVFITLLRAVRA